MTAVSGFARSFTQLAVARSVDGKVRLEYPIGKVLYEAAMGKDRQEFPEPFTCLSAVFDNQDVFHSESLLCISTSAVKRCDTLLWAGRKRNPPTQTDCVD